MASILLTGDSRIISEVSSTMSDGHDLYALFNEGEKADLEGLTVIESFEDIPSDLDALLLPATRDDGEIESILALLDEPLRQGKTFFFVNTLFVTATEVSALIGNRVPVIGISWIPGLTNVAERLEAAPALQVSEADASEAIALLDSIVPGEIEQVEDRIALVSARILAMIINEAAFAVMEDVADPAGIDTAMKLGTNYPEGPLAWVDRVGADVIVGILQALFDEYGEERYRPCVLLKQYARAGKEFHA